VGLSTPDQELPEFHTAAAHDRYRMGDVEDNQRLVDIHFEVATRAAKANRDVI
jgi:hypothetical protein